MRFEGWRMTTRCLECFRAAGREANRRVPKEVRAAHTAAWDAKNPERRREIVRKKDAKRNAQEIKRARRYLRAFGYFEGRPGWTSRIASSLLREKRVHPMCWLVPELDAHLAEFA
jgi:hypothetical protein